MAQAKPPRLLPAFYSIVLLCSADERMSSPLESHWGDLVDESHQDPMTRHNGQPIYIPPAPKAFPTRRTRAFESERRLTRSLALSQIPRPRCATFACSSTSWTLRLSPCGSELPARRSERSLLRTCGYHEPGELLYMPHTRKQPKIKSDRTPSHVAEYLAAAHNQPRPVPGIV